MDHIGVEDSLEGLEVEPFAPCMSCSSYGRSRGESPADAHPMHHLERGLVGNPLAELGSQTYDNLGAKAVVSGAREDLCERSARSSDLAGLFGCACTHAGFQAWGRTLSVCPRIGPERLGTVPAAKFPSPLDRSMDMITSAFMASCRPMPP